MNKIYFCQKINCSPILKNYQIQYRFHFTFTFNIWKFELLKTWNNCKSQRNFLRKILTDQNKLLREALKLKTNRVFSKERKIEVSERINKYRTQRKVAPFFHLSRNPRPSINFYHLFSGVVSLTLYIISDTYLGLDQQYDFLLDINDSAAVSDYKLF